MAAELQMPQNSLTLVVDASGVYYRVPVCVINDPITYDKDYMTQKLKKKEAPKKEIIQVSFIIHPLNHCFQSMLS